MLATNTSTLDITDIARAVKRPQDVIGMHFFSPANVMPLLEVVRTPQTSAEVIRTVMDLSKPLKKTPVLADVCYGFIGNRMMEGYAREAERMVLEGATPRQVDSALEQWGMAMGILAVFDMAGIDVGVNVHKANADRYPPDASYYQADFALAEAGRLGQKTGKGYYRYEPGSRARHDDPEAIDILRARASGTAGAAAHARPAGDRRALPVSADQRRLSHPRGGRGAARRRHRRGLDSAATVSRAIAAARCSMPRPSDSTTSLPGIEKYHKAFRPDALGAGAASGRTGALGPQHSRLGALP